jgi:5-methyltetrahydrofolate--homocysteine methyltransferase
MQGMGIDAFGLNCSTGPAEMLEQAKRLRDLAEVPVAIKPNAGLPKTVNGETVYDCPPDEFVKHTKEFAELGAGLFGGCCGTGPEHIAMIAPELKDFELRKPDPQYRDKIVCATEKDAFILEPGIEAGEIIGCGQDLEDQIRKANKSDSQIITVKINCEPDIDEFEAAQYAVRKPLCIVCEDAALLNDALAVYQGRALYAGSLSDEELAPLVRRYGLII